VTDFTYDPMGYLKAVAMPHETPNQTAYSLNEAGEVETATIPRSTGGNMTTSFDYDVAGNVKKKIDGEGKVWTYAHDLLGNVTRVTDPTKLLTVTHTDRLGRVRTQEAWQTQPSGQQHVISILENTYDPAGNLVSTWRRNALNNVLQPAQVGRVDATYDAAGRPETVTTAGKVTAYAYSKNRLDSRTDAAGTTSYQYFPATGRIEKIFDPFTDNPQQAHASFKYKPSGRLEEHTDANGLTTKYTYDAAGRLELKQVLRGATEVARFASTFDADSHVLTRTRKVEDGLFQGLDNGSWTYTYDGAGRLRTATDPLGVENRYDYDAAGNRTRVAEVLLDGEVEIITSTVTSYNKASRPVSSTKSVTTAGVETGTPEATTFTVDDAGRLRRIDGVDGFKAFTYNEWGHVATGTAGLPDEASPVRHKYSYDALHRTVQKDTVGTVAGVEQLVNKELYWYAGRTDELVRSQREGPNGPDATTVKKSYAYRNGVPYAVEQEVGVTDPATNVGPVVTLQFQGVDPHGDVVYLTDPQGTMVAAHSYDPWGEPRTSRGEKHALGFQSDPTDADLGFVDMGARNYLPELGRFLTPDSYQGELSDPTSQSLFPYGGGDPVSTIDPTGNKEMLCPNGQTCDSSEELTRMRSAQQQLAEPRNPSTRTGGVMHAGDLLNAQIHGFGYYLTDTGIQAYWEYQRAAAMWTPPTPEAEPNCLFGDDNHGGCWGARGVGTAVDAVEDGATRVGHVGRFALNSPRHVIAVSGAHLFLGGSCDMEKGMTVVCYNVEAWANGPNPHAAWGTVYTEYSEDAFKDVPGLLEHETRHTTQSALMGPFYELNYATESIWSKITTGSWACGNAMEIDAGLEDGQYECD
jgi:RHS repeat-associated protein